MNERYVLTPATAGAALPFGQKIDLMLNGKLAGTARWHAPESADGIVQVCDIRIAPEFQRQGHGSLLLRRLYAEATAVFIAAGVKPRRVWILIEQKRHVIARAFLSRNGFQHVSTMRDAFKKQDGMIYQRSFD